MEKIRADWPLIYQSLINSGLSKTEFFTRCFPSFFNNGKVPSRSTFFRHISRVEKSLTEASAAVIDEPSKQDSAEPVQAAQSNAKSDVTPEQHCESVSFVELTQEQLAEIECAGNRSHADSIALSNAFLPVVDLDPAVIELHLPGRLRAFVRKDAFAPLVIAQISCMLERCAAKGRAS